jgi:integrase
VCELDSGEVLMAGTRHDPLGALWALLATTGLRLGEPLGLQWPDLDLDGAELRVHRSLVRPSHGAAWLVEDPKSEKGRRRCPSCRRPWCHRGHIMTGSRWTA